MEGRAGVLTQPKVESGLPAVPEKFLDSLSLVFVATDGEQRSTSD
jgi:hypothetical protein